MTREEKQQLLRDLCARLPYGSQIHIISDECDDGFQAGEFDNTLRYHHLEAFVCDRIEIRPYLRPMSSMTGEEKNELCELCDFKQSYDDRDYFSRYGVEVISEYCCNGERIPESVINYNVIDFFHAHHLDWRGLIPGGLALEAPKGMYNN